jgi:heme/copper-type cytochrome/quinol oxidase subunit 3
MGTLLLLSSGATATLAHYGSLSGDKALLLFGLLITILLGIGFLALQLNEYLQSGFSIADSLFGSAFYLTTGLHGIHVIIGFLFLAAILTAISYDLFTTAHHLGLEFALWYWHLVDAVWLLVFLSYYSLPSLWSIPSPSLGRHWWLTPLDGSLSSLL